jgi:hypothetical protein
MFYRLRLRSNVFKVKEIVVEVVLGFFNRTGLPRAQASFPFTAEHKTAQATITRERTP